MKLVRFDGGKTGLAIELSSGPCLIDVVASVGALVPGDPISHGVLNGLLKENGSWAPLIQHWTRARAGLRRLAVLAQTPGSPQIVVRRRDDVRSTPSDRPDGIASLDIGESDAALQDPTGSEVMKLQFAEMRQLLEEPRETAPADDRVVLLSDVRLAR
jgi:hypothetical protein